MSTISDHYNYAKTKFLYNPQHIDQVKSKNKGEGASTIKAPPLDPPLITLLKIVVF